MISKEELGQKVEQLIDDIEWEMNDHLRDGAEPNWENLRDYLWEALRWAEKKGGQDAKVQSDS